MQIYFPYCKKILKHAGCIPKGAVFKLKLPCWKAHGGLCVTRDAAILKPVQDLAIICI